MISPHDAEQDWQGEQHPRLSWVPPYDSTTGDEAIELAAMAGLYLDPWQQWVLRHSLGERADGKWAAVEVGLVVGRQNGKNAVLEARELAELFLIAPVVGPRLIIHAAHQFKTSLEHFRRIKQRILNTPELLAKVKHRGRRPVGLRESHGEESIELADGSRLLFAARTSSGGQGAGFTADLLVWDEAWNLPDSVVGAVMPTLSARTLETPGVQVWYTSQAVNQQTMPYGVQLARVRERGIAGDEPRLFYAEWSVDEEEFRLHPEIADDPAYWAKANPGLGIRIAVEHVWVERRGAMPWLEFLAHRLGVGDWPPTSDDAKRVIPADLWTALADPGSRISKSHTFALDVDPGQAWATISAAGERDDGLFHVGVVEHDRGTGWVVERCKFWLERFSGSQLVVDPRADLGALLTELDEAGVQPIRTTAQDYKAACGGFFQAVVDKRLRYMPPQPELDTAVAGARTKPLLDAWKWDRASGALITPLVSCTLALWGARTQGAPTVWNLDEIAAQLRGETAEEPAVSPEPTPTVGQTFIPIDQAPVHRGLFQP